MHKNPMLNEAEVSTQSMKHNDVRSTEAPFSRNKIDSPLKKAHGTVAETVEHTEDRVTRQVA